MFGVALLAGGLLNLASASGAVGAPDHRLVNGTGTLHCTAYGKVTFAPALTSGGTSSTTVKVTATLKSCTGSGSGATVKGGSVKGTITGTPSGNCTVTQMSTTGTLTAKYTVTTGSPPLSPSTLSFNTVQAVAGPPVSAQIDGAPTSGSFVGDGSFLSINIKQTSPCGSLWTFTSTSGSTFSLG
jgi:hypothetical protein